MKRKGLILSVVDSLRATVVKARKKTTDVVSMFSLLILPLYAA